MPKCSGIIGYVQTVETQPGIWSEKPVEKRYYGDIVKDNRKLIEPSQINSDITISNNISIVCNKFMLENLAYMKYLSFMNSKWKISSVDIKPPRMIITLGGLYNEQ
jgi:hypothetical protein